jgi:Ni/Co efflux regulator RcnB
MKLRNWVPVLLAAIFAFGCNLALAQEEGHDRDRGHDREEFRDGHDRDHFYGDHDREAMRGWYAQHRDHLPPGLRDRDRLPPEMERRLVVHGILPVELRGRMYPCPPELERQLPPPPPDCTHVFIGGHVVLMNRVNFQIVDVFHFEL